MTQTSTPHDLLVALLLLQRAVQRRGDRFFAEYGVTDAQFNILNLLASNGGFMDQLTLIESLLVGKSSISIVLSRMTKAGLVERREHEKDRRQSVLTLTAKGRKVWSKVAPKYEQSVKEIFGRLPESKRQGFIDDMEIIHAGLADELSGDRQRTLRELSKNLQPRFNS